MISPHTPASWQEFLGQLIEEPKQKRALAEAIRVRPITLKRWVEGISRPYEENIRMLLKKVPAETYPLFMRLLLQSFPELLQDILPEEPMCQNVASEFYARALSNLAFTPQPMYRLAMQDLLFQQQIEQLDPNRWGLVITIAVCVPPRFSNKVRSLREIGGLGTPPWHSDLSTKLLFLGAESLVGYAVDQMRPCVINSREDMTFFPANWTEFEKSAAAFPIFRQGRIIGGLIVSSAQEFFFTETRLSIIEEYSHLVSCIFEPEETYAPEDIELRLMPSYMQQLPYFQNYNQRVARKFAEAEVRDELVMLPQVRQLVWQDIEDDLLQVLFQTGAS